MSFKLSKILRWELLKVDVLQCIDSDAACVDVSAQDLSKRCRACVASAHRDNCEHLSFGRFLCCCLANDSDTEHDLQCYEQQFTNHKMFLQTSMMLNKNGDVEQNKGKNMSLIFF